MPVNFTISGGKRRTKEFPDFVTCACFSKPNNFFFFTSCSISWRTASSKYSEPQEVQTSQSRKPKSMPKNSTCVLLFFNFPPQLHGYGKISCCISHHIFTVTG